MRFTQLEKTIVARLDALAPTSRTSSSLPSDTPPVSARRTPSPVAAGRKRRRRRSRRGGDRPADASTVEPQTATAPAPEAAAPAAPEPAVQPATPAPVDTTTTTETAAAAEPASDSGFAALGLGAPVLRALEEIGFREPTPIQQRAIGPALAGRDVVGQARTGTGKTAAFGLPLIERTPRGRAQSSLVLAPTRELAHQVHEAMTAFARHTGLRLALIYGGVSYRGQRQALEAGAEIIVGTPGRVLDLHRQRILDLGRVERVVLDECDRMFDLGFRPDILRVLRHSRPRREQLLLFSATIDGNVEHLVQRFMRDPVTIETVDDTLTVDRVSQHYSVVAKDRKTALLAELVRREREAGELGQAIVFCRTRAGCDRLAKRLGKLGLGVHAIHGDLRQSQREKVLGLLREGKVQILVATNVAARGLDVGGISHVFNYDVPEFAEDYVHRIGRTARMGAHGKAFTLVEPGQGGLIDRIEKLTGAPVHELRLEGFDTGVERRVRRDPGEVSGTILFRSTHRR
ncbi:MAG: DEAD/DEAH box helicase [Planctomycetota bacterium]|nr:MAG: DEAD/DEAH box helicase [Planctomycetota bacterium]